MSKKIQVKMLKHVAGTGQAGEIVQVTPAFFSNKLLPSKSAEMISDEEVERQRLRSRAQEAEAITRASEIQSKISNKVFKIIRKSGPNGQLFGGVSAKCILAELQAALGDEFLRQKEVKILELLDVDGKKISGDIKHTGEYGVHLKLYKDINAKFGILVLPED